ncbi:unnamed protein product [Closterium sp. NIES-64]|nr:unnamed protein product [Closterium sp. NIES-64]
MACSSLLQGPSFLLPLNTETFLFPQPTTETLSLPISFSTGGQNHQRQEQPQQWQRPLHCRASVASFLQPAFSPPTVPPTAQPLPSNQLQHRRTEASEAAVAAAVAAVTARARASLGGDERRRLEERDPREREELSGVRGGGEEERGEGGERDGVVLGGRQTGSVEWRAARGKLGLERKGDGGKEGGKGEAEWGKAGVKEGKDGRLERRIEDGHMGALLLGIGDMCCDVIGSPGLETASTTLAAAEQKSSNPCLDALLSLLSVLRSLTFRSYSLPLNNKQCDPFCKSLLDAAAMSTFNASGSNEGTNERESLLTAMGVQIWKEGENKGSEGTGWVMGVKDCETRREEGTCENGKGGAAGVGGWRYGQRVVLAAMALQAAQEVLPRVKQALEQMRTGNDGDGDAARLQALVQHARVCGGWVSADGESAPREMKGSMAVSACDASLHTKWLHHQGGKGMLLSAAMPYCAML